MRLAWRLGVIDRPRPTRLHTRATPLMGGVAVAVSFVAVTLLWRALSTRGPLLADRALLALLVGALFAVLLGVLDEILTLRPAVHFVGQVAAVVGALLVGFPRVSRVSNPFVTPGSHGSASVYISELLGFGHAHSLIDAAPGVTAVAGAIFTVFWIVGMMNAVNFLDGVDGLAGGVSAISALFLGIWAIVVQQSGYAPTHDNQNVVLPLILCGALAGFLLYNWSPARIFMGDSGAMFVGYTLGALSIFGPVKLGTALLLLTIPIVDVAWAITRRLLHRRSFAAGDHQHIFHRLLELGLGPRAVVLIFYGLCTGLGIIDVRLYKLQKLVAFTIVSILVIVAAIVLEIRGRRAGPREEPSSTSVHSEETQG